jgi:hypothetical protein
VFIDPITGSGSSTLAGVTSEGVGMFSPASIGGHGHRIWRSPGYGTHRSSGFGG